MSRQPEPTWVMVSPDGKFEQPTSSKRLYWQLLAKGYSVKKLHRKTPASAPVESTKDSAENGATQASKENK